MHASDSLCGSSSTLLSVRWTLVCIVVSSAICISLLLSWLQDAAAALRQQIKRGASMSLADCFRMELGMVYHCFEHSDLMEGIRAVIVDKDYKPRWKPATLEELQPATVAAFFAPRWNAGSHPLRDLERRFG